MADVPNVRLNDGIEIPQVGFGVFQVPPDETQRAVEDALAAGYRHIDTAAAYRNERGVAAGIAASGVPRAEIFITTKLWNTEQGFESTLAAFDKSIEALDTETVDLYLIHWPVPSRDLYLDTWRAFERIHAEGGSRTIGVSNFRIPDLERLAREAEQQPTINQVELHPLLQQGELRAFHAEHGIDVGGYLTNAAPVTPAAADVEQSEPGNRLAFRPAELGSHDLVAGADRENHRTLVHRPRQPAARAEPPGSQNLRQVLTAAKQVDITVRGNPLIGIDLGDLDRNAAKPRPAGEHKQVAAIAVGAEQVRVHPDQPDR